LYATSGSSPIATNEVSESNLNFSACTCDLTPGGCDHACCCDVDCNEETKKIWRRQDNFCLDEIYDKGIVTYDDCATRAQKALLSDLEGLTAFDKTTRQMMCTLQQSDRSKAQSFVYETLTATDNEQF
jgi:hypothetical protein